MNEHVPTASATAAPGNRAKVFVSYSRKDLAFAQMMVGALAKLGFDAFLDKTDIAPGEPWKERLAGLIATADTVVFTVSPDSVASPICGWELEESARLGKRIIPVVARRIADTDAPPALGRLNWVFLAEGDDKDAALATLDTALHTDLPWVREHTRLGELARRWSEQGRRQGATLRGADLEAAERWLDHRPADANAPTDLHQDFIRASRRAATARQRYWVGGSLAVAVIAIALAAFAEVNRREAQTQRERAEHTLSLATGTANGLVFDLAQKFRNVVGVPAATIKDILDRARQLQDQLFGAGESNPSLRLSQAEALDETADTLLTLGETDSSLAAAKQAQELFQALQVQQPASVSVQHDLAVSYERIGDAQQAQGNLPAALTSYQAEQAISDRLAKLDPGNAGRQRNLAGSYDRIGGLQVAQGKLQVALTSYQAALAIMDRLAKSDPGNSDWQDDLSVSYEHVGDVQGALGNLAVALTSYQASQTIMDRLSKSDLGNARWQRGLAASYNKVGNVQRAQGNLSAALASYQASLAVADRLAKSDPTNTDWQRDLAISYQKIGDVQAPQGNLPAALASYQASKAISDRLAKSDSGNARWQRDEAISYERIGNVEVAQGNLPAALTSYQAEQAILDRVAKSDPGNAGLQRDLAETYEYVGDVLKAQDNMPAALTSYQAALAIFDRVAKSNPGNAGWQRDLSVSYQRVGYAQAAQDDLPAALASYQAYFAIAERLAKSNPRNTGWQRDLALSYYNVGKVQFDLGRLDDALNNFNAAIQIGKAPDNSYIYWQRAMAKLYTNDTAGAADDAAMALKLKPANSYYIVGLHVMRARAGQNDADEMAANAKNIDHSQWPWPIIALFLGSINPDAVQTAAASSDQESTRVGQSCEADFYIGLYRVEKGAQADARPLFQSALDHCPHGYGEYAAAKLELKRLDELAGAQPK